MRVLVRWAILLGAASVVLWLVFSWFEAGKEVRFLCAGFGSGMDREQVLEILGTGEYLRHRSEIFGDLEIVVVDSAYTLGTTRCRVEIVGGKVHSSTYD